MSHETVRKMQEGTEQSSCTNWVKTLPRSRTPGSTGELTVEAKGSSLMRYWLYGRPFPAVFDNCIFQLQSPYKHSSELRNLVQSSAAEHYLLLLSVACHQKVALMGSTNS